MTNIARQRDESSHHFCIKKRKKMIFAISSLMWGFFLLFPTTLGMAQTTSTSDTLSVKLNESTDGRQYTPIITQKLDKKWQENPEQDLLVSIELKDVLEYDQEAFVKNLKITGENDKDYSNEVGIKKDVVAHTYTIHFAHETLEKLIQDENTQISIRSTFSVPESKNTALLDESKTYTIIAKNNLSEQVKDESKVRSNTLMPRNSRNSEGFLENILTTVVDENGVPISEKTLNPDDLKKLIVLRYFGTDLLGDITIRDHKQNILPWDGKEKIHFYTNYSVTIKNAGYYQGKPISLEVISTGYADLYPMSSSSSALYFSGTNTSIGYSFTNKILNENGQEIPEKLNILFPLGKTGPSQGTKLVIESPQIKNVIVDDSPIYNSSDILVDHVNNIYTLTWNKNLTTNNYDFSVLLGQTNEFKSGIGDPGGYFRTYSILNKNAEIVIPLDYPEPFLIGKEDGTGKKIKAEVTQFLPKQSFTKFYKEVTWALDLANYSKLLDESDVLLSSANGDLAKKIAKSIVTKDDGGKVVVFKLSKDDVEKWSQENGDTEFKLSIEVPFNVETKDILPVYNKETQNFDIPLTLTDETGDTVLSSSTAYTKMQAPTGKGIPVTVDRDTSTTDLNAADLVTDLNSMLKFDTVEVVGFKENKTFERPGPTTVEVVIRSKETGITSLVPINVTVTEAPLVYVTASEKIELKQVKTFVRGSGNVSYTGYTEANIKVRTANSIKLTGQEGDNVDLEVFKADNTRLKTGEDLTTLNHQQRSYDFALQAPKDSFKKVDLYKGSMMLYFELLED